MKSWGRMDVAELTREYEIAEMDAMIYEATGLDAQAEEARDTAARLSWVIGARLG